MVVKKLPYKNLAGRHDRVPADGWCFLPGWRA